ncbi:hypothetical protein [Variovorax paradoxus]|uniref:Uncharacterized protein n=1 Tax=Variovorax paradoxus TaxID=34073 RepID=A0A6I6HH12_VARPD|nr:hypothetical protein [Variovorax paradoxus]QGW81965.1 hypothetical protein GOQ09_10345 [Variovorax paradoxus]
MSQQKRPFMESSYTFGKGKLTRGRNWWHHIFEHERKTRQQTARRPAPVPLSEVADDQEE